MTTRLFGGVCLGLLLAVASAPRAQARLGDLQADLRQRFGRPEAQPSKQMAVWLIEDPAGALLYTVTFNDRGQSIAEGLKPYRSGGALSENSARQFMSEQITVLRNPAQARVVKPGESYSFAGETLSCGPNEHIVIDEKSGFLMVWTRGASGSVMVASPEMLHATRR